jgi:hypothetical protein
VPDTSVDVKAPTSGTDEEKGDELLERADALDAKRLPGAPQWIDHLRGAIEGYKQAKQHYEAAQKAARRDPDAQARLDEKITRVNRGLFWAKKRLPI